MPEHTGLALSVRQPYADQIITGEKPDEYRSQPTNVRGRIYIYASLGGAPASDDGKTRGAVIGEVTLAGCRQDETYGDYAWELRDPVRWTTPRPPVNRANPVWFRPWDETVPMGGGTSPEYGPAAQRDDTPPLDDPAEGGGAPLADASGSAKRRERTRKRRTTSSDVDTDDAMARVRQFFVSNGPQNREAAIVGLARAWGFARAGSRVANQMDTLLRTAARRGIVESSDGQVRLVSRTLDGHAREQLKRQFTAAMGRGWVTREEAVQRFTRWMGFSRTGAAIADTCRSLIRGMVREGRVHKDGDSLCRR